MRNNISGSAPLPILFASFILSLLNASPSRSQTLTYTGSTAGGPTWNRPIANNDGSYAGISPTATAVPYQATPLFVELSGSYNFLSTATNPANWDNYLFLYAGSFAPSSPSNGYVIGNDDNPSQGESSFSSVSLTANTQYYLVTTGFFNSDKGSFSNTVTGPGIIRIGTAAPEPSSASLATAVLVVGGISLRMIRVGKRRLFQ